MNENIEKKNSGNPAENTSNNKIHKNGFIPAFWFFVVICFIAGAGAIANLITLPRIVVYVLANILGFCITTYYFLKFKNTFKHIHHYWKIYFLINFVYVAISSFSYHFYPPTLNNIQIPVVQLSKCKIKTFEVGKNISIDVALKNYSDTTPATKFQPKVWYKLDTIFSDVNFTEKPPSFVTEITLPQQEEIHEHYISSYLLIPEIYQRLIQKNNNGKMYLFVYAEVTFYDQNNILHVSKYCRFFVPEKNEFMITPFWNSDSVF